MDTSRASAFLFLTSWMLVGFCKLSVADIRIIHIDVGQGDATYILDTISKKSLLVDAGNRGYGRRVIAPLLKDLGATQITYFLATHYDADHIGGFNELIDEGITVTENVFDRGNYTHRKMNTAGGRLTQYGEYIQAAGQKRETVSLCNVENTDHQNGLSKRQIISMGDDTQIEVVAACGKYLSDAAADDFNVGEYDIDEKHDNDLSIALVVRHGDFDYFIGGDLTGGGNRTFPMEQAVAPFVGNVDVLKINHHGSETSTSEALLELLKPESAIISVGDGGVNLRYRLPRQTVLDRLAEIKPKPVLFQTHRGEGGSYDGAYVENRHIVIYSDGKSYTINGVIMPVDERTHH